MALMPVYRGESVAVVDAYGAGQLFGAALRASGLNCVHVANRTCDWSVASATFNAGDFVFCVDYDGDLSTVVQRLGELGVEHVIAGTESGSVVADRLATALGCRTANAPGMSAARRDKRLMHQIAHAAGLAVPSQQHLDADANVVWSCGDDLGEVVVVKPPASAGTESVKVLRSGSNVRAAALSMIGRRNLYGESNDGAVIQEFLHGTELVVNAVSTGGDHAFLDVWASAKQHTGGHLVYDRQQLLSPRAAAAVVACDYVRELLDVLGVRWGASHTELALTSRGPVLLETATRLPGGTDPALTLRAIGTSQAREAVESLLEPGLQRSRGPFRELRLHAMGVSLIAPATGVLRSDVDVRQLRSLASFRGMRGDFTRGRWLQRTVDLVTKPGGVYLCHESMSQIEADYRQVRAWECTLLRDAIQCDGSSEGARDE